MPVQVPPSSAALPARVPEAPAAQGLEPPSPSPAQSGTPRDDGSAPVLSPPDGLQVFRNLKHRPVRHSNLVICEVCASYMQLPDGPCRQLALPCKGIAKVPSTRANHLAFLRNAAKGLHPKVGCPLEQVPQCADSVGGGVESSGGQLSLPVELEDAPIHVCPTESASINALHEVAQALRGAAPSAEADPSTDGSGSD